MVIVVAESNGSLTVCQTAQTRVLMRGTAPLGNERAADHWGANP